LLAPAWGGRCFVRASACHQMGMATCMPNLRLRAARRSDRPARYCVVGLNPLGVVFHVTRWRPLAPVRCISRLRCGSRIAGVIRRPASCRGDTGCQVDEVRQFLVPDAFSGCSCGRTSSCSTGETVGWRRRLSSGPCGFGLTSIHVAGAWNLPCVAVVHRDQVVQRCGECRQESPAVFFSRIAGLVIKWRRFYG